MLQLEGEVARAHLSGLIEYFATGDDGGGGAVDSGVGSDGFGGELVGVVAVAAGRLS